MVIKTYQPPQELLPVRINVWDVLALFIVLGLLVAVAAGTKQLSAPFHLGEPIAISLDPWMLPSYALQTVIRLLLALSLSLVFTLIFATWAAKSKPAGKIIIPIIDILQSVPVLAFLSLTIVGFIALFPNSLWGPQCACIFLIFTAQAWNMALSLYQSLITVPGDLREASDMLRLSAWQRFWRVDVPFSMPALLWNMMMSMSASWFSLVAAEAITVDGQEIALPGIGSYIALAINQANMVAVVYAIVAMLIVIIIYDQLLFRPLIAWSEKFKVDQTAEEKPARSWVVNILRRTQALRRVGYFLGWLAEQFVNFKLPLLKSRKKFYVHRYSQRYDRTAERVWDIIIVIAIIASFSALWHFVLHDISVYEVLNVIFLGSMTALRVLVLIVICSLIWVPIGVWVGMRPQFAEIAQPVAQLLAAFPANLFFPVMIMLILKFHLNIEIWTIPLMMLGAQWYVLFNVIAGASAIPKDLRMAAANFRLHGWLWWRRFILPAIFPYYITGAITAVGGAWNASIVAEVVNWGPTTLQATGLGAYIAHYTGNYVHTVLGVVVMCLFVFTLNRILWRPLYNRAIEKFSLD